MVVFDEGGNGWSLTVVDDEFVFGVPLGEQTLSGTGGGGPRGEVGERPPSALTLRLNSGDFFRCLRCGFFGGGAGLAVSDTADFNPGFFGGGAGLGPLFV